MPNMYTFHMLVLWWPHEFWLAVQWRPVITGLGQELQERAERLDAVHRADATVGGSNVNEDTAAAAPPLPVADSVAALRRRYQVTAAIASPADESVPICWRRLRMDNALRAQEGHSAAMLDDRWMVVIGGEYADTIMTLAFSTSCTD